MDSTELTFIMKAKDEASAVVHGLRGNFDSLGTTAANIGKAVAAVAIAGAVALGGIAVTSMKAAADAQVISAQTDAVLKSTAGASGMTTKSVNDLATSLSLVTPFEDDLVAKTENMLLTFTSIGKDVFPAATEAALNMATALGEDPVNASIQLGKALNDPIQGITALRRVGVSFTDAQKEVIAKLVETGDTAGAQKLILKELQTEFGNSARAAGDTFSGKLAIAKNALNNVQEAIGGPLITAFAGLLTTVTPVIIALGERLPDAFTIIGEIFGVITGQAPAAGAALSGAIGPEAAGAIMGAFGTIRSVVDGLTTVFGILTQGSEYAADGLDAFGGAGQLLYPVLTTIHDAAAGFIQFLKDNWDAVMFAMKAVVVTVVVPMFLLWAASAVAAAAATVIALAPVLIPIAAIGAAAFLLYQVWNQNMGGIQEKTQAIWLFLSSTFNAIVGAIQALWTGAQAIWQQFTDNPPKMIGQMVGFIIGFFMMLPGRIASLLGEGLHALLSFVGESVQAFTKWGQDNEATISSFLGSLPGKFWDAAVAAVQGLINGFGSMVGTVTSSIRNFFGGLVDGIKSSMGISSPSTVMAEIGRNLMQGVAIGVKDASDEVVKRMADTFKLVKDLGTQISEAARIEVSSAMSAIVLPGTGGGFGLVQASQQKVGQVGNIPIFGPGSIQVNGNVDSRSRVEQLGAEIVTQARARGLVIA